MHCITPPGQTARSAINQLPSFLPSAPPQVTTRALTFQRSNYNYSSKQSENNRLNAIKLFISERGKFHALNRPSEPTTMTANDVCFNNFIDSSPFRCSGVTQFIIYDLSSWQIFTVAAPPGQNRPLCTFCITPAN